MNDSLTHELIEEEEEEEEIFDVSSSFSDSGPSGIVDDLLINVSINNNQESQLDSAFFSRSTVADVSFYPKSIKFPMLFPNLANEERILISNKGSFPEHFSISQTGSDCFLIENTELDLQPGETIPFYVKFQPISVNMYQGTLIFESRTSELIQLTGHCVPSPLDIPAIDSPLWRFPNSKSERKYVFANRSYSLSLEVFVRSNSEAVKITPDHFTIPTLQNEQLLISFNPEQSKTSDDPMLFITCQQSGDNLQIPLQISGPRSCINVDFGSVTVGSTTKQYISLKTPQVAPKIEWPFNIENVDPNGISQGEFDFSFCSKIKGYFATKLTFKDFDIQLTAQAIEPPYDIHISSRFPKHPIKIVNTSDDTLKFRFSLSSHDYLLDINESLVRPNQVIRIHAIKFPNARPAKLDFLVFWTDKQRNKLVIDRHPIENGSSSATELQADVMSDQSVPSSSPKRQMQTPKKTSFNSNVVTPTPKKTQVQTPSSSLKMTQVQTPSPSPKKTSFSPRTPSGDKKLKCSTSFIPFFGLNGVESQVFSLSFTSQSPIKFEFPQFVTFPNDIYQNKLFDVECFSIPHTETKDALVAKTDDSTLTVPIYAYKGASSIEFDHTIPIIGRTAALEVKNKGGRAGFIAFISNEKEVVVNPQAGTIKPFDSLIFQFTFTEPLEKSFSMNLLSGDEIVRQIKAALRPNHLLNTAFTNCKNELGILQEMIEQCDRTELAALTRHLIDQGRITFIPQTDTVQIVISPSQLEFSSCSTRKFSITNQSTFELPFNLSSSFDFVDFSPDSGVIPPNGTVSISVTLNSQSSASISIQCNTDTFEVPLLFHETSSIMFGFSSFSVSHDSIDFNQCELGLNETQTVIIKNETRNALELTLSSNTSVFTFPTNLAIQPRGQAEIEVTFTPTNQRSYEDELIIEDDSSSSIIKLTGEGMKAEDAKVSEGEIVRFPKCQLGLIKRAKVRVANTTSQIKYFKASANAPFVCPVTEFEIEPKSYVLFPIHFAPRMRGEFDGTLEFISDKSKVVIMELSGTCE